jgi:starch synthase
LNGILNGIDTTLWDPSNDPHLPEPFSARKMKGKTAAREKLLDRFGLKLGSKKPIFSSISRLVPQKGLDVVARIVPQLVEGGGVFILLGSGQPSLEAAFLGLARDFPESVAVRIGFDEPLAHVIEAGSDFFLMPSRFEPCGLNQMYSQRYGTVPIVTATGGLADSVTDWQPKRKAGTGIVAASCTRPALTQAVRRAFKLHADSEALQQVRARGMACDFSWSCAAVAYETVYARALGTDIASP